MIPQNITDIDSYNKLSANEQLKKLHLINEHWTTSINELRQINYKTRVKEAKENDPNYVEHKISASDIDVLISILSNEIDKLDYQKLCSFNSKKSVRLAWKKLGFMKENMWIQAIKKRSSLYLFVRFFYTNQEHKWATYISHLSLKKRTNNQILLLLTNHAFLIKKQEILETNQSIQDKNIRLLQVKLRIAENDIFNLQNNVIKNVLNWQKTALEMRSNGAKVQEICVALNKGRTVVSSFLNKPESKEFLGI